MSSKPGDLATVSRFLRDTIPLYSRLDCVLVDPSVDPTEAVKVDVTNACMQTWTKTGLPYFGTVSVKGR